MSRRRASTRELFVAPDGKDGNPGTLEEPFATPEAARDALRRLRPVPGQGRLPAIGNGCTVWFRGGVYERRAPFTLDERDSGTARRPVVYRSFPGERARLVGGRRLPAAGFRPVTDRAVLRRIISPAARRGVLQIDLRKHGVRDFGRLALRGFGHAAPAHLELFFNGAPMQLARYPNEGRFLRVAAGARGRIFRFRSGRPALWSRADDVWLHGYWKWIWADLYCPCGRIDARAKTITLREPAKQEFEKGKPFYAVNLLEEIDRPGEWYLDRRTGILYFLPPKPGPRRGHASGQALPEDAEIIVSTLKEDLLRVTNAAHVRFRDLTLEVGRRRLAVVEDGEDIVFDGCALRNAGNAAARIAGRRCGLEHCEVAGPGDGGVSLHGGDRRTLRPAGNFVRDCHIHHFGRWSKTYTAAVSWEGVGQEVAHNHVHDGPHAAMVFSGNDHVVECNHIHDVGQYASNGGAIYTGLGWDQCGSVIRHNVIHDCVGRIPGGKYGIMGIYLDDCNSGNTVHGNVLSNVVGFGLLLGGGRHNTITNNVFVNCGQAFAADSRGLERINNQPGVHWNFVERLTKNDVRYRSRPWARAYPWLARIPNSWKKVCEGLWRYPEENVFSHNVGWRNEKFIHTEASGGTGTLDKFAEVRGNRPKTDPRFRDPARPLKGLRPDSPLHRMRGFEAIPFEKVGPRVAASGRASDQ